VYLRHAGVLNYLVTHDIERLSTSSAIDCAVSHWSCLAKTVESTFSAAYMGLMPEIANIIVHKICTTRGRQSDVQKSRNIGRNSGFAVSTTELAYATT
jgi:hypothetical protein